MSIIKQLDAAFAPENYDPDGYSGGGRSGGRSSSLADGTWHAILCGRRDGPADVVFHDGVTQAGILGELQKIGGYSAYRRIGSVIRSKSLLTFVQAGAHFSLLVPFNETVGTAFDTTQRNYTLAAVPSGVEALADVFVWGAASGGVASIVTGHPSCTLPTPSNSSGSPTAPLTGVSNVANLPAQARHLCRTNTSAQIAVKANATCTGYDIYTFGWMDQRGKNA